VKRPTLEVCGPVARHDGRLLATLEPAAQAEATGREGCDVWETEGPPATRAAQAVPDRARDRQAVEPDVRTRQTGRLAVRPLGVRQALRTRAQVVVTLVAVNVVRARRRALAAAFGPTADATMAVTGEEAWRAFARRWLLTSQVQGTAVTRVPTPEARQQAMLDAWGTP
jgi:hypothetical protein